ncbi:MAG: molybdenum cofactor guanylyltransferase [Anaerolineales bacterium]
MPYTGVVLAGGRSERLGRDKRRLLVEGEPLLAWVVARLRPLVREVVVVTRKAEPLPLLDVRRVTDRYPGMGVLAGVHAGLEAAREPWAYVVAGDLPLLNADLLRALAALAGEGCDVVVPRWRGELEPLHALYRPSACASAAEAALRQGRRRIVAFYAHVRVCELEEAAVARIDPEGRSFFNVNTWEEWARLQELVGE